MTTSFAVGSVFEIIDKASPVIARISREMGEFGKLVKNVQKDLLELGNAPFAGLGTNLKSAIDQVAALSGAVNKASKEVIASSDLATASVRSLTAEWTAAATAARAAGTAARTSVPPVGGAAAANTAAAAGSAIPLNQTRWGHNRRSGLISSEGLSVPFGPGRLYARGAGTAGTVGLLGGAYSIWESLDVADLVAKGLANVYPEGAPSDVEAKKKELTNKIIQEARVTKLSLTTVAKMALDEVRTNANQPWEARMRILPSVIESASREAYLKGVNPEIATTSFVGQLHQQGAYTPEEIEKMGPMLTYFMSKDPNALVQIGRSSAYHSPISRTMLGIPFEQDLAAQVVLDRTGVGGKSGTWLREMVMRAAKPIHDKNYDKKVAKLREFGLMDESDHPTWMTDGRYDESKLLHTLSEHLKDTPIEDRAAKLRDIFKERGAGAIALLTDPKLLKQYDAVVAEARSAMPNKEWWEQQNISNQMQRAKGALTEAQIAALSAGQILTAPAVGAATGAATVLGWGAGLLPEPDSAASKRGEEMGKWAVPGAIIGGVLGAPGGPMGVAGGAILGGAIGAELGYLKESLKMLGDAVMSTTDSLKKSSKGDGDDARKNVEQGAEKGSESGTEKGAEKGILGGMLQLLQKMNFQGDGLNGGGLINAAFTTTDGGALHSGGGYVAGGTFGGPGRMGGGYRGGYGAGLAIGATTGKGMSMYPGIPNAQLASEISQAFAKEGVDPHVALALAEKEGAFAHAFTGDRGTSFGAFQWHHPGLRDVMLAQTGLDAADPNNRLASIKWLAHFVATRRDRHGNKIGWGGDWLTSMHKLRLGPMAGIGTYKAPPMASAPGTTHFSTGDVMDAVRGGDLVPPPASSRQIELHHTSMLDGRVLTKTVTKHLVAMGNRPGLGGRMADYSATRPLSV